VDSFQVLWVYNTAESCHFWRMQKLIRSPDPLPNRSVANLSCFVECRVTGNLGTRNLGWKSNLCRVTGNLWARNLGWKSNLCRVTGNLWARNLGWKSNLCRVTGNLWARNLGSEAGWPYRCLLSREDTRKMSSNRDGFLLNPYPTKNHPHILRYINCLSQNVWCSDERHHMRKLQLTNIS